MWTSLFGLSLIITLNLLPLTHSTHPKLYARGGNSCYVRFVWRELLPKSGHFI